MERITTMIHVAEIIDKETKLVYLDIDKQNFE